MNPSLVLVQPRKTHSFITKRLLLGCKESNQTNKTKGLTTVHRILVLVANENAANALVFLSESSSTSILCVCQQ